MAKKKEVSPEIKDLKEDLIQGKTIIGTDQVIKSLKNGKLEKIYLASNSPDKITKDIDYYSELAKVPIIKLDLNNEELGVLCKKHFFISVIGIKNQ